MAISRLDDDQVESALETVPQWALVDDHIERSFTFADFAGAFGFMASVAVICEGMNHHPEWSNIYSKVQIRLTTHDVGGLSGSDFDLARRVDTIFEGRSR